MKSPGLALVAALRRCGASLNGYRVEGEGGTLGNMRDA